MVEGLVGQVVELKQQGAGFNHRQGVREDQGLLMGERRG